MVPARVAVICCAALSALMASNREAAAREWVDATGEYRVEADLVEYDEQVVTLRNSDDKLIKVPILRLSLEDRKYLAELNPAEPATPSEEELTDLAACAQETEAVLLALSQIRSLSDQEMASSAGTIYQGTKERLNTIERRFGSLKLDRLELPEEYVLAAGRRAVSAEQLPEVYLSLAMTLDQLNGLPEELLRMHEQQKLAQQASEEHAARQAAEYAAWNARFTAQRRRSLMRDLNLYYSGRGVVLKNGRVASRQDADNFINSIKHELQNPGDVYSEPEAPRGKSSRVSNVDLHHRRNVLRLNALLEREFKPLNRAFLAEANRDMQSEFFGVRAGRIPLLGWWSGRDGLALAEEALDDPHPAVRAAARKAMLNMATPLATLHAWTMGEDPEKRLLAAQTLYSRFDELEPSAAASLLGQLLADEQTIVRQLSYVLLDRTEREPITEEQLAILETPLKAPNREVVLDALLYLDMQGITQGDEELFPLRKESIQHLLNHADEEIRQIVERLSDQESLPYFDERLLAKLSPEYRANVLKNPQYYDAAKIVRAVYGETRPRYRGVENAMSKYSSPDDTMTLEGVRAFREAFDEVDHFSRGRFIREALDVCEQHLDDFDEAMIQELRRFYYEQPLGVRGTGFVNFATIVESWAVRPEHFTERWKQDED